MTPDASRRIVDEYLEAFAARDVARCVALFDTNAVVEFLMSSFTGLDEIAGWHAERFAANLRVLRVERVDVGAQTVQVDVVVGSERLAAWKITSLRARATIGFAAGRIVSLVFAPRVNPIDLKGAHG